MQIWNYQATNSSNESVTTALDCVACIFCSEPLRILKDDSRAGQVRKGLHEETQLHVRTCDSCGWWWAKRSEYRLMTNVGKYSVIDPSEYCENRTWGATSVLKALDVSDINAPIAEVRNFLVRRYEDRFKVNPQLFERTVASVFGHLGYQATATAYSGDDGIDVILEGPSGDIIGVQVKRYKDRIGVDQIRELAGALVLQGTTKGIFVTTSDYQSGAYSTVDRYEKLRGIRIELLDARRFFDQLKLAQRNRFHSLDEADAPYLVEKFTLVKTETYRREMPDIGV